MSGGGMRTRFLVEVEDLREEHWSYCLRKKNVMAKGPLVVKSERKICGGEIETCMSSETAGGETKKKERIS
jgi:hypothetical protein